MDQHADNAATYPTRNLTNPLTNHFGTVVQIIRQQGTKPSLICSSIISVGEMCELAINLQKELEEHQLQTESDSSDAECSTSTQLKSDINLFYLAQHLRNIMKDVKTTKTKCSSQSTETHTDIEIS